jgi:hypothetical protein
MFNYECCSVFMIKAKTWKNKPKTQTNWSIDEDFQIDLLNLKKYKINLKTITLQTTAIVFQYGFKEQFYQICWYYQSLEDSDLKSP